MPSPFLKSLAKEIGKTEKELEQYWNKAKEITAETFGKKEDDFGTKEYKYITGIVKNMAGVKEEVLDPSKFIESDLSAKEFIETVVSADFSIGNVYPPEEEKDNEKGLEIETKDGKKIIPEEDLEDENKNPRGEIPDGTGPHGRGTGPGKGKADGSGLNSEESVEEDIDVDKLDKVIKKQLEEE